MSLLFTDDAQTVLEQQARAVLSGQLNIVTSAAMQAFDVSSELKALAEPILSLTEGIQTELTRLNDITQQIDDAVAILEPYRQVPQVAAVLNLMQTVKPIVAAQAAVQTARQALALLSLPDPNALAAAGLVAAANEFNGGIRFALGVLTRFVDGDS